MPALFVEYAYVSLDIHTGIFIHTHAQCSYTRTHTGFVSLPIIPVAVAGSADVTYPIDEEISTTCVIGGGMVRCARIYIYICVCVLVRVRVSVSERRGCRIS
jgi:hypothetical protein